MDNENAPALTGETIEKMTAKELINGVLYTFDVEDRIERERLQALMIVRADELNVKSTVSRLISTYRREDEKLARQYAPRDGVLPFKRNSEGKIMPTIDNFLTAMRGSGAFDGVRFNLITNAPEIHEGGTVRRWDNADDAEGQRYIEHTFGLYSEKKFRNALRLLMKEREYNPIIDIVGGLEWDGVERCEHFLSKWAMAEDTAYTREVSRLIFAGGINRLYRPGCKFDEVPVLIGTHQGEGKSTLVRWLAIHDEYFAEIKEVDGQKSIEQLDGVWIGEIAELLMLTKAKEQEAVKSFITTQRDRYRRPYDVQVEEYRRRCIFIGTTNNEQFLKDKTGNRRFYPVKVYSNGYDLFDHEEECRDYILQCWAEARVKLERGEMPNYASRGLLAEYQAAQDEAMEDDWRVGVIEAYLDGQEPGALVCIRQLKHDALTPPDGFAQDPSPKESQEIATIMNKMPGWERVGRIYIKDYGRQRCWRKAAGPSSDGIFDVESLPF